MYLTELHGHGTSASTPEPGASGAPTEWTARTNSPDDSIAASASVPIRVMIRIEVTTYGESVISTPSWEISPPSGPMQNGTTYMTRPRMQPSKISAKVLRICSGAIQLLVGPASCSRSEQMNVRSSTRATSPGSHSACEPSHQTTASGLASSAISPTHPASSGSLVAAGLWMGALSSED